jgi:S1-C subfamily serine protease
MSDEKMPPLGWAKLGAPEPSDPAAAPTTRIPTAPVPEPPAEAPARRHGGRLGVVLLVIVLLAAASGAAIGHEAWIATRTTTVSGGTVPSSGGSGTFGGSAPAQSGSSSGSTPTASGGVSSAIVNINSTFSYQAAAGAGTGIVLSSSGVVLTNNHVIDGATKISATDVGNGKTYSATVLGYDPTHDIAVLQLQGASDLQTAKLGDSSKLTVGQSVVGLGNAGGTGGSPTSAPGHITALGQSITAGEEITQSSERLSGLIQVDAPIQSGDSGGPLVDDQGRVIGMDTAGSVGFGFATSMSQAYAIPINQALATAKSVVAGKGTSTLHVGPTAFLGILVSPSSGSGFSFNGFGLGTGSGSSGVTVGNVVGGAPAAAAGLGAGDTITSLDGQGLSSDSSLSHLMLGHHPGDKVQVGWTDTTGQSHTSSVTLASGPPS